METPVPSQTSLSPVTIILVMLSLIFSLLGVSISVASHFQMIRVLREIKAIIRPPEEVKKSGKKRQG